MNYYVLFLGFLSFVVSGAEPLRVENRRPLPDEIGYFPSISEPSLFNPPSFAWLHEQPASRYDLEWATNVSFHTSTLITNLPFNTYTHSAPLRANNYFWRYRYHSNDGQVSSWSQTRQFSVSKDAVEFPMPSSTERRQLIPRQHPRLFVRPEDLADLRQAARESAAERFKVLVKEADKLIRQAPTLEPTKLGSTRDKTNVEQIQNWWPNREIALKACTEAETVAFVYLITREKKYGDAARQRLIALASWDPDGPTSFKWNCEASKPMLHRLSRAYDWAYEALTSADRKLVQASVRRRIKDAWESGEVGRGVGHLNRPLKSHGNRTWHKIGESGIVFLDEIPEAELWLEYALNKYYACYPVWSDSEGGWHEGAAYLGGYMAKTVWWLHTAQTSLKLDPLKKPFFSQVGDFPLYVAPPHSPNTGFGDLSYNTNVRGWGAFMEYFNRVASANPQSNAAEWRWWGEQWNATEPNGVLGFLYAATLPDLPDARPPTNLPPSKVFHGIGVASLHTTLLNSSNDIHFLFKSSPFGSQSHGHNPQNTFQLNAYGDALLTPCVYRDLHGSEFHEKWVHQTISQNGILVNRQGQKPHSALSTGKITDTQFTPEWDYVVGDAKEAYEGRLHRALRHVVFLKPDTIVLFDDLVAKEPSDFQFMLHGLSEFDLNESASELHIQRPNAGANITYLGSSSVKFRQWDGFEPKPMRGTFQNQWHVEASTVDKKAALRMFTVIAPHRGSEKPTCKTELLRSTSADGVRITMQDRTTVIAFRNPAKEVAQIAGFTFKSPMLVEILQNPAEK